MDLVVGDKFCLRNNFIRAFRFSCELSIYIYDLFHQGKSKRKLEANVVVRDVTVSVYG